MKKLMNLIYGIFAAPANKAEKPFLSELTERRVMAYRKKTGRHFVRAEMAGIREINP